MTKKNTPINEDDEVANYGLTESEINRLENPDLDTTTEDDPEDQAPRRYDTLPWGLFES